MGAVAGVDALQQMIPAGVIGRLHQVDARLIQSYGIQAGQNADVLHAGIFGNGTAVAVHAHVAHNADVGHVAAEVLDHAAGGVCHAFQESILGSYVIPQHILIRGLSGGVDVGLAGGGGTADGQLLQRAAEAAHGMALEVGEHQHGVVVVQVFANQILFDLLAVGDFQLQIGAFGIHDIHIKIMAPAMVLHEFDVLVGGVPLAAVGGVAFHDGTVDRVNHGLHEFGPQKVLVALLAGVDLDCDLAGQGLAQRLIQPDHIFRGDVL